jgi:hypothetical protein
LWRRVAPAVAISLQGTVAFTLHRFTPRGLPPKEPLTPEILEMVQMLLLMPPKYRSWVVDLGRTIVEREGFGKAREPKARGCKNIGKPVITIDTDERPAG